MDGWVDRQVDEQLNGQTDGQVGRQMDKWMDGQIERSSKAKKQEEVTLWPCQPGARNGFSLDPIKNCSRAHQKVSHEPRMTQPSQQSQKTSLDSVFWGSQYEGANGNQWEEPKQTSYQSVREAAERLSGVAVCAK